MTSSPQYALDNDWTHARERLSLLEAVSDPGTIRHLQSIGVGQGWGCLEIGGGGGSIAAWLCRQVGAGGQVVATDINTSFLQALDYPNLEARQQDIVSGSFPEGPFDLVHARAVLVHLPARDEVLRRTIAALKPGGWLLVEEPDYVSKVADPANNPAANRLFDRIRAVDAVSMDAAGIDAAYGRGLYRRFRGAGLIDVQAEGRVPMAHGGSDLARFYRLTSEQQRGRYLAAGIAPEEFEAYLALHDDPEFVWMQGTMMAVWGRRPL